MTLPDGAREIDGHDLRQVADEPPPMLGTWPRVYAFVLIYLACTIFLFWLFTRHYAPTA